MITLVRLDNAQDIIQALLKDELYKNLVGAYFNNDFDPQLKNTAWFIGIREGQIIGLVYLNGFLSNSICLHTGLYKEFRGKESLKIFLELLIAIKKIISQTIVLPISPDNHKAKALVMKAGFKYKTTIESGFESGPAEIYTEV